jgi:hypothetical protein
MAQVDLICLANSRKLGGRCVAGLRLDGSGWVRRVDSPQSHRGHRGKSRKGAKGAKEIEQH